MFLKTAGWMTDSVYHDQMLHTLTSDLGLHCFLRTFSPMWGKFILGIHLPLTNQHWDSNRVTAKESKSIVHNAI